jgi:hypothetical protein
MLPNLKYIVINISQNNVQSITNFIMYIDFKSLPIQNASLTNLFTHKIKKKKKGKT